MLFSVNGSKEEGGWRGQLHCIELRRAQTALLVTPCRREIHYGTEVNGCIVWSNLGM
jgi:hypothetical protein